MKLRKFKESDAGISFGMSIGLLIGRYMDSKAMTEGKVI